MIALFICQIGILVMKKQLFRIFLLCGLSFFVVQASKEDLTQVNEQEEPKEIQTTEDLKKKVVELKKSAVKLAEAFEEKDSYFNKRLDELRKICCYQARILLPNGNSLRQAEESANFSKESACNLMAGVFEKAEDANEKESYAAFLSVYEKYIDKLFVIVLDVCNYTDKDTTKTVNFKTAHGKYLKALKNYEKALTKESLPLRWQYYYRQTYNKAFEGYEKVRDFVVKNHEDILWVAAWLTVGGVFCYILYRERLFMKNHGGKNYFQVWMENAVKKQPSSIGTSFKAAF